MALRFKNRFSVGITAISNEFIDQYMAGASGEYLKVYLYLMRHEGESVTLETVADALNHTEADVRRALSYWQKAGVLATGEDSADTAAAFQGETPNGYRAKAAGETAGKCTEAKQEETVRRTTAVQGITGTGRATGMNEKTGMRAGAGQDSCGKTAGDERQMAGRETSAACDMERLSADEAFSQLIYIAQKYLNKTFTPMDCQVFANLYQNLGMPPELLEFLVEYCAQNGHSSMRYVEKVALNWHEKNILTVEEARAYSRSFSKESFAVMKAMGLTGRSPADSEYTLMEKWFRNYGFTKEIVVEACNRTMKAIHNPSFQYVDRILTDWKEAGVRTGHDIEALDKIRKEQVKVKEKKDEQSGGASVSGYQTRKGARSTNRFHNLEEHGYDYDEMVWDMINSGQKQD